MALEAPPSPPRAVKTRRGGKISSRKEKINVVSKASLAMFNPAYAMGIEPGPSWCDSPVTNNDDYDSVREWGVGGVAAAAASVGAPPARSGARTLAGAQAWAFRAEKPSDANWRNSPTPELEAFTVGDLGVIASAQSSKSDLTASSGEEELAEQACEPAYEPLAPVYDRRPSLPLFESDGSQQMPGRSRRGTLSRVHFNATGDGEAPKTLKSPGGSSLSRFFTWKRTAKNALAARNAMPPLPSALDGFPLGDFPVVPQSAPPGITTFEQAASAVIAAARRPSLSNEHARAHGSDSEYETLPSPSRAAPGLPPLDFGTGTYPATALDGKLKISSTHRASRHLGRKHSMPTLREVRRAQSKQHDALPDVDSVCWDESVQVGMLGSISTNAPAPVLPPVNLSGSLSPLIPASPSWASLGQPRSRISSVGRGSVRRGTESIYDNLASPKSPKSPTRNGRRNEFIVDEEHNKAYAGVSSKAKRRRSRSVGATCGPPPRLSRFGAPPLFTPKSPEISTFSPLLGRGAGAAHSETAVAPGVGRGRATVVRVANQGHGTPTQQNVAVFGGGEASLLERGAYNGGEASDGSGGNDTEVETRQARRVNLNHGRNGTRAVAVASPKLVARSPHLGSAPARSPLAQQGRFVQAKLVHSKVAQPVVVNVMPPTPDMSNQERNGFNGESPATLLGTAAIIEEHTDSDEDSADENDAYDAVIVEPVPERRRNMVSARVAAAAARRRDTVVIDQSTWAPNGGFPQLPFVEKAERKRVVSDAASELSDFSVSSVSSAGADGPFALARSLSSNSLSSTVSCPCASPATRREIMVSSPSRSGSSQSVTTSVVSAQLSLYSFGSSASLSSTTTTSTSILDLGIMTPSASEVLLGGGAKLRTPFTLSSAITGTDEPLGEDCDTPKLSGIGSQAPTAFASPIRSAAKLPSPNTTSPHLELDLTQALDLQGLSDEYPATTKNSPVRRPHLARIKTSPPKPIKSRARSMAPITPPHTPSRAQTFVAGAMEQSGMGLGLGLDFGGEQKKLASTTPALRVVKRSATTKDVTAPHAALWGELGFAI